MPPKSGHLYVIAAPSGAGKTSLVRALLQNRPDLCFSISYTTRKPRATEQHGRDYFFVDQEKFKAMVAAGEFLEYAQVFDNFYGTARAQVEAILEQGSDVILEIDW
jgi:guanylate kinase